MDTTGFSVLRDRLWLLAGGGQAGGPRLLQTTLTGRDSLCVETRCLGRSAGQLAVRRDRPSEEEKHSHPDVSGAYESCSVGELMQLQLGLFWTMADGQCWLLC